MTKEYKIVTSPRVDRFEEAISKLLNDGWELQGSPFVSTTGSMTQGLLRDKPNARKKTAS